MTYPKFAKFLLKSNGDCAYLALSINEKFYASLQTKHKIFVFFSMNSDEKDNRYLDELADRNGLAIIVVDGDSSVLSESNDNSICRMLYNSAEFSSHCAEFCGRAFEWATEAGKEVEYKCYAGLNCMAVQTKNKKSVAIIGRVFLKAEDYRSATTRAATGDWKQFPANQFFGNTLFGSTEDLGKASKTVTKIEVRLPDSKFRMPDLEIGTLDAEVLSAETTRAEDCKSKAAEVTEGGNAKIENPKLQEWRSLFGAFLKSDYKKACLLIAEFVGQIYSVSSLAWLERRENSLETLFTKGALENRGIQLSLATDDSRLLEAVRTKTPLELHEQSDGDDKNDPEIIRLFPFAVGGEVQSALVIGDDLNDETKRKIARFCQKISSQLEILRLREQLSERGFVERAVKKFNENLKNIDSEDFWSQLVHASAELMRAERSSLLIFDEKTENFTAKAATGIKADLIKRETENLGLRVAKNVLNEGSAVVVKDINKIGLPSAPQDWLYKSASFISYPITIGERKIGVLNLTDKADGNGYDASDIKLLDAVMPSLAVMIDRADLKHQAGEFKQLSVTDALTGLLNRRYLEERLTEEIKRSNRHGFPMSFLMIDVDEFKSYNDNFGHTEGDKALQMVGACLKETLRGADVAARYGGEEFSILLPQTSSAEAEVIAERIRERVEMRCFPNRQVTISIGIASCSLSLNSSKDLVSAADKALYEAKRSGRNNVQVYESLNSNFAAGTRKISN